MAGREPVEVSVENGGRELTAANAGSLAWSDLSSVKPSPRPAGA
jgi:hypothetical protein